MDGKRSATASLLESGFHPSARYPDRRLLAPRASDRKDYGIDYTPSKEQELVAGRGVSAARKAEVEIGRGKADKRPEHRLRRSSHNSTQREGS